MHVEVSKRLLVEKLHVATDQGLFLRLPVSLCLQPLFLPPSLTGCVVRR